jgi:hypothetical protein
VVSDALAGFVARNQQQPFHAGQRRTQSFRAGVVGLAYPHCAIGEVGNFGARAHNCDDVGCGHAAGEQLLNRKTPQLA